MTEPLPAAPFEDSPALQLLLWEHNGQRLPRPLAERIYQLSWMPKEVRLHIGMTGASWVHQLEDDSCDVLTLQKKIDEEHHIHIADQVMRAHLPREREPRDMFGHRRIADYNVARTTAPARGVRPFIRVFRGEPLFPGFATTSGRFDPDGYRRERVTLNIPWWWGTTDLGTWPREATRIRVKDSSNDQMAAVVKFTRLIPRNRAQAQRPVQNVDDDDESSSSDSSTEAPDEDGADANQD